MASERYVRWQSYTISQLTFALNLFLGLSLGSLAFAFSLVRDKNFLLFGCPKTLFQISLISLCLSTLAGCFSVVSRLLDFRFTAKKIRSDESADIEDSSTYKYSYKILGSLTWRLFWLQVLTLGIGLFGLISGVFFGYSSHFW